MSDPTHLVINGKPYSVQYDLQTPLFWVLHDELNLTGTKYGCGEGQCGSCTILIDGSPRRSCQLPLKEAVGARITTIEGLEIDGHLHPLQEAFLETGAFQCAFCTTGMIMSSLALLQNNPDPSPLEIAQFLQGNICRCGTYPRIIDAVRHAAKSLQERGR